MAKQVINIGSAPDDGSGDTIRNAYDKTNQNFTENYDGVAANAQALVDHTAGNPHGAMIWRGLWLDTGTYLMDEVVRDGDWTSIVKVASTTERPAPQNNGNPEDSLDPAVAFDTNSDISVVKMVHRYSMNKSGWSKGIYVKAPVFDADSVVRVTVTNETSGEVSIINDPILTSDAWVLLTASNSRVIKGEVFRVDFEFYNSSAASNINGGWTSGIGIGSPPTTEFTIDDTTTPTQIIINHTDLDTTVRATELDGVTVDSIILVSETGDAARNVEMKVTSVDTTAADNTKYLVTTTSVGNNVRDNKTCTISIDVPVTQPSQFYGAPNYYPAGDPSFAAVTSELFFDDVSQGVTTAAYGIYVTFQEAYISPDWDIVSYA